MYYDDHSLKAILQSVQQLNLQKGEAAMLLFGEKSDVNFPEMIELLNSLNVDFFGGIFPGIIHGASNYTEGYILKKLPLRHRPIMIKGLENNNFELPDFSNWLEEEDNTQTLLTFVDGLTGNIALYLEELFHVFGNSANFIGGGGGSLTLTQKPCIFSNEGIFQDAGVICAVDLEVSLGVKHGWQKMMGPIVATKTDKNIIYELNWTNAFELYKKELEKDGSTPITSANFFDVAKAYPFGVFREHREDIVRDPIAVGENGELICVGEVPENTVLYILKGENHTLIQSADLATQECLKNAKESIEHTLIVVCISRTLFLEEEFPKELEKISSFFDNKEKENLPQGILSLGEISSYGNGVLEFYNKTLVVGALFPG